MTGIEQDGQRLREDQQQILVISAASLSSIFTPSEMD